MKKKRILLSLSVSIRLRLESVIRTRRCTAFGWWNTHAGQVAVGFSGYFQVFFCCHDGFLVGKCAVQEADAMCDPDES